MPDEQWLMPEAEIRQEAQSPGVSSPALSLLKFPHYALDSVELADRLPSKTPAR